MKLAIHVSIVCLLFLQSCVSFGVWDEFDLVRPRVGAWGSDWQLPYVKISGVNGSGPVVPESALFGTSVANIGDLDNNGFDDLAVGAPGESGIVNGTLLPQAGAIYILFMHSLRKNNLEVLSHTRISAGVNNGPQLLENAFFGFSVANVNDLNGDGINEIMIGAPGARLGTAYILYMHRNGTVRNSVVIGAGLENITYVREGSRLAKGNPALGYFSRFGSMVAPLGDFDEDGIPDLAIGAADASGGASRVFLCWMQRNGDIREIVELSSGLNGAPIYDVFTNFGASLVLLGDLDGDRIPDLALGAYLGNSGEDALFGSGVIYTLLMNRNGTVKAHNVIHALSQAAEGFPLPLLEYDNCGTALGTIGDLNLDMMRGHKPWEVHKPTRGKTFDWPIPDLLVGCPQGNAGILPGRAFVWFMTKGGGNQGYINLPNDKDKAAYIAPDLKPKDQYGSSLAPYQDVDRNSIKEIVVGAPGDHDNGYNTGALYILFLRRRRFHPYMFDWRAYYCGIFIPIGVYCVFCWGGIRFFFWYYRRKPDEIELMVKASDIEITKTRKTRQNKVKPMQGGGDEYEH